MTSKQRARRRLTLASTLAVAVTLTSCAFAVGGGPAANPASATPSSSVTQLTGKNDAKQNSKQDGQKDGKNARQAGEGKNHPKKHKASKSPRPEPRVPVPDPDITDVGSPADQRPNVIVILTDDMRADDLNYMPRTQRLMVERGINFTNASSPHPLCCPARAELLTGQYAQNNGVRHNTGDWGAYEALDPSNTVGTWYNAGGYRTGFTGKYVNLYNDYHPRNPGWHVWKPIVNAPTDYFRFQFYDGTKYEDDYVTNRIEENSNDIVRKFAGEGRPFFAYFNHVAPHERQTGKTGLTPAPAEPQHQHFADKLEPPMQDLKNFLKPMTGRVPPKMLTQTATPKAMGKITAEEFRHKWEARIEALQSVDEAVESLYKTLRETGELDNTYVFLTSDNGYALGENTYYRKDLLIDPVLNVPLVATGPGITGGVTSDLPVTLVDLVATTTELTGVKPQLTIDGSSFAPVLHGQPVKWRDTMLIQTGADTRVQPKSIKHPGWSFRGVNTERYLFALGWNTGDMLLLDRNTDPLGRHNAAYDPAYRKVVAELEKRTRKLMDCNGTASCNRTFGPDPKPKR